MKRVIALSILVLSLSIASPMWAQELSPPAVPSAKEGCDPGIAEIVGPKRFENDCLAFQKDLQFARFKDFEENRYNEHYRRGSTLRTTGIVLTSIGSGALIASVVLLVRAHRLNEEYADDHPGGDFNYGGMAALPESITGAGLMFFGGSLLVAGVSVLIPGIRMKNRAEAALNYLHQKPTAPLAFTGMNLSVNRDGVGLGMTLAF